MDTFMLDRKIQLFISTVEEGSFSAAASLFQISQSAVSQQIRLLESELDVLLFDRNGYRPVLTKVGQCFYKHCKVIYEACIEAERQVRLLATENQDCRLRLGVTGPMEEHDLPKIAEIFKKQAPKVMLDIKKITFGNGYKGLKEGILDVAFGIANDFKDKDGIRTVVLMKHRICVVCSLQHPWAKKSMIQASELADQDIISLSKNVGSQFYLDFLKAFEKDGIVPHIIKEVDSLEEMLLAVRLNQGIALTSREVITPDKTICMLDVAKTHHHAEFCLAYRKGNQNPCLPLFIDEVISYYKKP
ncbi:LysR family transcriptional regulator [uncultured Sphaerochaeta sp.]|uniref:LysR family transcriptional regulator n=1 Tax=uncultured Sphaerochaeta sp. TaxID=886478 RepID=UPI002A0A815D|nr:LysR family transcriptional regulator [uncultured Sphaerochaeta sp.]